MDAIGILFYVIPGLIAFGIDFATGAIYYPGGRTAQVDPAKLQEAVSPTARSTTSSCRPFSKANWASACRWTTHG
jgi:hypothetical protein